MKILAGSRSMFQYRLTLLLKLLDTSSGNLVKNEEVEVFFNSNKISVYPKDEYYLIMNHPREDGCYLIRVSGYEEAEVFIKYDQLDQNLPVQSVFLIPQVTKRNADLLYCLQGNCLGMECIDGIAISSNFCLRIQNYQEETRIVTVSNPYKQSFYHDKYALHNIEKQTFESFEISEILSANAFAIKESLRFIPKGGINMLPLIVGKVDSQGNYIFRAKIINNNPSYLVRYQKNGQEIFQYEKVF